MYGHPNLAQPLGAEFAFGSLVMDLLLEFIECRLADHRIDHVFDLRCQHYPFDRGIVLLVEKGAEGQHLAENRCGLGEGQRRSSQQLTPRRGQGLVDAVTKFMSQGHDVARLAAVVHQDIGVSGRHRRM